MKRNEIERRVNEMVFDYYDYQSDTMEIEIPLTVAITATVTKRQGENPECELYDYDVEGDGELFLPNVCDFIEKVVEECIKDIFEQHNSPNYDDEMFEEWTRGGWR